MTNFEKKITAKGKSNPNRGCNQNGSKKEAKKS